MTEVFIKDLDLIFGDQTVFKNLNFLMKKKERVVLFGPSGIGKTSFLKLIAGLVFGRGSIEVHPKKIGMIFQKNALFDSMTCFDQCVFTAIESLSCSNKDAQNLAHFYLEEVGLSHAVDLYPREISGGMQKRLGLARALCSKPELLLCDDPTAGLDPVTSRKITSLISKESEGKSVISVANDVDRFDELGERKILVWNQTLIEDWSHEAVKQFILGKTKGPLTEER